MRILNNIYFSQRDERWADEIYSSVGNSSQTIKSSGCGPTSSAMVISSLTGNAVYPNEMAKYYVENGFRTASSGTSWSAFPATAAKWNLEFKQTTDVSIVLECIKSGGMVIASTIGSSTALFSTNGHFIVLIGIENNNFIIYDSDLYNGKYTINGRDSKVTVDGLEITVSVDNTNKEVKQYFCFYPEDNFDAFETKSKYVRVNTSLNIRSGPRNNL